MIISDPTALANLFAYIKSKSDKVDNLGIKKSKYGHIELAKEFIQQHILDTANLKGNKLFFSSLFSIDINSSEFFGNILSDSTVKFFFESTSHNLNQAHNLYSKFEKFSSILAEISYTQFKNGNFESAISSNFASAKEAIAEMGNNHHHGNTEFSEVDNILKVIEATFPGGVAAKELSGGENVDKALPIGFSEKVLRLAVELYNTINDKPPVDTKEFEEFLSRLDKSVNDNKNQLLEKLINISFLELKSFTINSSGALADGKNGSVYLNLSDLNFLRNFIGKGEIKDFVEYISSIFKDNKVDVSQANLKSNLKYKGEFEKILLMLAGLENRPEILVGAKDLLTALALNSSFDDRNFLLKDNKLLFLIFKDIFFQKVSQFQAADKDYFLENTNYGKLADIVSSKENVISKKETFREFVQFAREFVNLLPSGDDSKNSTVAKTLSRVLNEMVINFCINERGDSFAIPFHCEGLNDFMVFYHQQKKNRDAAALKSKQRFSLSFATEKLGAISVDIVSGNSLEIYIRAKREDTRDIFRENMPLLHERLEAIQSKLVKTY